jgi:hypothetical protein
MAFQTEALPRGEVDSASATETWLVLDADGSQRFRLPNETSLDFLEAQIKAAMRTGDALTVDLVAEHASTRSCLVLNGHALAFVLLTEIATEARHSGGERSSSLQNERGTVL